MLRRLAASLMLWAGILAVATPALACNPTAAAQNCCPGDGQLPCGSGGSPQEYAVDCAAPVIVSAAALDVAKPPHGQMLDDVPAASLTAATGYAALAKAVSPPLLPLAPPPTFLRQVTWTYLHTQRLRL